MKKWISVIDDNEEQLKLLQMLLESQGYSVQLINDPKNTFDILKDNPPHLIMLDLLMPEISGIDLLVKLKKDNVLSQIPILILTGVVDEKVISAVKKFDIAGYLIRPVRRAKLFQKINYIFKKLDERPLYKIFDVRNNTQAITIEGDGVVLGIGETTLVLNSNFSFTDNMTLNLRADIFGAIGMDCDIVKTLKTTPYIGGDYKYKNKLSLVALSESALQRLRSWANKNSLKAKM